MMYEELAPIIQQAKREPGLYFIVVDSGERHFIQEQVEAECDDFTRSRPPMIHYMLPNESHIRFLAAGALDVLKAFNHADGVYIAPFATTRIDKADRARIKHLCEQGAQQRRLKAKLGSSSIIDSGSPPSVEPE